VGWSAKLTATRSFCSTIDSEKMEPGTLAVVENDLFSVPVGKTGGPCGLAMGLPLDGKGPIKTTPISGVFKRRSGHHGSQHAERIASGVKHAGDLVVLIGPLPSSGRPSARPHGHQFLATGTLNRSFLNHG